MQEQSTNEFILTPFAFFSECKEHWNYGHMEHFGTTYKGTKENVSLPHMQDLSL